MTTDRPELEALLHDFEQLLRRLDDGQPVADVELIRTAERIYQYVRLSAVDRLSAAQMRALVVLSTARADSRLDLLRGRAQGAIDMYTAVVGHGLPAWESAPAPASATPTPPFKPASRPDARVKRDTPPAPAPTPVAAVTSDIDQPDEEVAVKAGSVFHRAGSKDF